MSVSYGIERREQIILLREDKFTAAYGRSANLTRKAAFLMGPDMVRQTSTIW
jgi:hypothetical protein